MKKILRIIALLIALGAVVTWVALGANRGITKTQVQEKTGYDEFLQQDVKAWKQRFVPGVDFLAAAFVVAGILTGVSFLFRIKSNSADNGINSEHSR